jgi:hypothetical protein
MWRVFGLVGCGESLVWRAGFREKIGGKWRKKRKMAKIFLHFFRGQWMVCPAWKQAVARLLPGFVQGVARLCPGCCQGVAREGLEFVREGFNRRLRRSRRFSEGGGGWVHGFVLSFIVGTDDLAGDGARSGGLGGEPDFGWVGWSWVPSFQVWRADPNFMQLLAPFRASQFLACDPQRAGGGWSVFLGRVTGR